MSDSYNRWAPASDIPLQLQLVLSDGAGATGLSPEVSIRRMRVVNGSPLDGWYWNGATFQALPYWLVLSEVDAVSSPGLYTYLFEQSLIGEEWIYLVYYRSTVDPIGFAVEEHFIQDADPVWDATLASHLNPGSTGLALSKIAALLQGAYKIKITVEDSVGFVPLQGVNVDIYDATDTYFIGRMVTNVLGQVTIALDAGTYSIRLFKTGYSFTVPETLVIIADANVSYLGSSIIVIIPPAAPNLCAIYGWVRDASGHEASNVLVTAYAVTPQVVQDSQQHDKIAETLTDGNGYFRIDLERGVIVNFVIENTGIDATLTVPDAASQDVTTWS
jgi:hypothetical protein